MQNVPVFPCLCSEPLFVFCCLQVRDLFGTGRVFKRRVRDGEGEFPSAAPMHDCTVRFHYKARTLPDRVVVHGENAFVSFEPLDSVCISISRAANGCWPTLCLVWCSASLYKASLFILKPSSCCSTIDADFLVVRCERRLHVLRRDCGAKTMSVSRLDPN